MSKNQSSTGHRYKEASKQFDKAYQQYLVDSNDALTRYRDLYSQYTGDKALQKQLDTSTDYASKQADMNSMRAANMAGASSNRTARTAGLSKAQAALLGEQAASDTAGKQYQSAYDTARQQALNASQQNNALGMQGAGTEYSTRMSAATAPMTALGGKMSSASAEDQNAYNRAWGNVGGIGSLASGLLSDKRLKDYRLLKVNYGGKK